MKTRPDHRLRRERTTLGAMLAMYCRDVHCHEPQMRARAAKVMRHAGPRMLRRHPFLAVAHLHDRRRRRTPTPRFPETS